MDQAAVCREGNSLSGKPAEELDLANVGAPRAVNEPRIAPTNAPINAPINVLQRQIIEFIRSDPATSYDDLAQSTKKDRTTIMRHIAKLKTFGLLKRIGPNKGGHWEILE